jgi:hypothetical protein
MKKNNFIYLVIVAVVVFFGVVVLNVVKDSSVVEQYVSPFEQVSEENLQEIKISSYDTQTEENDTNDQEGLTISRNDSGWKVGDYDVDSDMLSEFIQNITGGDVTKMISSNTDSFDLFEVSDAKGKLLEIVLKKGREEEVLEGESSSADIALIVGKSAPVGGNYFRYKDGGEVYVFSKNLAQFMQKSQNDWRSKVVIALDPSEVKSIETDKITLTRQDSEEGDFVVESDDEDASFDQEKIDLLVSGLLNLRAVEVLEGSRDSWFKGQDARLNVEVELGQGSSEEKVVYQIYTKKEAGIDQYYAYKEGDGTVYRIDPLVFEELNKAPSDVK